MGNWVLYRVNGFGVKPKPKQQNKIAAAAGLLLLCLRLTGQRSLADGDSGPPAAVPAAGGAAAAERG